MKVSVVVRYRCSKARYLEQYFDPEGRHRRVVGMGGVSFTAKEVNRTDTEWRMVGEMVERTNMPAPVRAILGSTNCLEERSLWVVGSDAIQVELRPVKMRDKVSIKGTYTIREQPDGTTEIAVDVDVVAKIFGIGGMVEKIAAKEMPLSFTKDAAFFNEHMADT